jgi:hypothetical protein
MDPSSMGPSHEPQCYLKGFKMMQYVRIDVSGSPSDDELRNRARNEGWNGEYVTRICRKCGIFECSQTGRTEEAKIVDTCSHCFDS